MVYDTGSDWLCLESVECEAGNGPKFDFKASTSFKQQGTKDSVREYGSAVLRGKEVTDLACIVPFDEDDLAKGTPPFCKENFEWFMVSKMQGLNEKYSGVCGLARSKFKPERSERKEGPLLIKQIAQDGNLAANLFSFYMDADRREDLLPSFIDFGKI